MRELTLHEFDEVQGGYRQVEINIVQAGQRVATFIWDGAKWAASAAAGGVLGNAVYDKYKETQLLKEWQAGPPPLCAGMITVQVPPDFVGPPEPNRCGGGSGVDISAVPSGAGGTSSETSDDDSDDSSAA